MVVSVTEMGFVKDCDEVKDKENVLNGDEGCHGLSEESQDSRDQGW